LKAVLRKLAAMAVLICAAAVASASPAAAGPWAEVGDSRLRSDIEILAAAGVIDDVTMQWPLPWSTILARLNRPGALNGQPAYVQAAARRVAVDARRNTHMHRPQAALRIRAASTPAVVHGFSAVTIDKLQTSLSYEYVTTQSAIKISVGTQGEGPDHQGLVLDDSYAATLIGPVIVYAGYKTHWWGPGWVSALSLSNNARPMPQVGFSRSNTSAFKTPWLSWLGPWQFEFFVALMDGQRVDPNTIFVGTRLAFSPLEHFEIGISRVTQMCGRHHSCRPLIDYINPLNNNTHVNNTNDQLSFDFKYSEAYENFAYELYAQLMNEDNNPIINSGTSKLFGASLWLPFDWGSTRFTVEYADSRATRDLWGGERLVGFAYNNGGYFDGMRYRGRTLGFSLDSDSQLFSLQAAAIDDQARSLIVSYHHAVISTPRLAAWPTPNWRNVVSSGAVTINTLEAQLSIPVDLDPFTADFGLTARLQDDQPRPQKGATATLELSFGMSL
jgi:hypothetical protein